MRPIDADALIEKCGDWYVEEGTESGFIGTLKNLLATEPTIQPEPQWIPVSERLPEVYETGNSVSGMFMKSRPVLVYGVPEYESEHGFHVVTYCDDLNGITYWSTELDAVTINGVIAWMPLPEPYQKGVANA